MAEGAREDASTPPSARSEDALSGARASFPVSPADALNTVIAATRGRLVAYPRGSPSPRVAITLRWISDVPPAIVADTAPT